MPEPSSARNNSERREAGGATAQAASTQASDNTSRATNSARRRQESRFLRACRREPVDRTPLWLMRQAGRFLPWFREIRSRVSFLGLCKDSALACEVTVRAANELKVDAAIIFADILLPLEPLGVGLEYIKGEGPHIERPIRSPDDVVKLGCCHAEENLGYVLEAIKLTRAGLPELTPLIGFAGAPFTLASYMIEGGSSRHFEKTKQFMYSEPQAWHSLMTKLAEVTAQYLQAQVNAGADALQLFDSWVGCLSPSDYQQYVMPYSKQVVDTVSGDVPFIHFGTGTAGLLSLMSTAGGTVIGTDWRLPLDEAWKRIGHDKAIQGNLDPIVLLGPREELKRQALRVLAEAGGRQGHIFNLGHGVLPPTDPEAVHFLVDLIHSQETGSHG